MTCARSGKCLAGPCTLLLHAILAWNVASSMPAAAQGLLMQEQEARTDRQLLEQTRGMKRAWKSGAWAFQPAEHGVPGFSVRRHLVLGSSPLPMGDYYEVMVEPLKPGDPGWLNVTDTTNIHANQFSDCFMRAQFTAEPMSPLYEPRNAPPRPLPGGVNRAFYMWPGNVSRADFDAVPYKLRGPSCGHCTNIVSYKIIDGKLYRGPESDAYMDMMLHRQRAETMVLAALYLFQLPNMDFKMHFGDGCPAEGPVFSWNVCRDHPKGGFTMPSTTAWMASLGPVQTQTYHACLAHKYPARTRNPVAFWRGTNTDPNLVDNFTEADYRQCARIRLHMDFKPTSKTRIDAKLSSLIFADKVTREAVGEIAPKMAQEDFNKAAIVLDMDGNGWSDRWVKIVQYNTFMLKQASNNTAFFEHLLAPGYIGYFKNDLSDLQQVVDRALQAWDRSSSRLMARARMKQAFAAAILNHASIIESMAHALLVYSRKCTWTTVMEDKYTVVPFNQACSVGPQLPQAFCANIQKYKP